MEYKYQQLFDQLKLVDCPDSKVKEISIRAYRWSYDPIQHGWNFLPNVLHDNERNRPPRVLEKKDLCKCCNLSFFTIESVAYGKLKELRTHLEKKHISRLDIYTHIAGGYIDPHDGRATPEKNSHFGFYEYIGCEFKKKFDILREVK
jgi:hypothetical protein